MHPCLKNVFLIQRFGGRFVIALILRGFVSVASAQTIKLATLAPEGSAWMNAMRAGAAEIGQRTDGRVKFKFYGGGVQGNDKQVLRKMLICQLHGGAFTSNALVAFQKDAVLYGMPMLFNNMEEVRFVRDHMDDKLSALLEQAGYVNFGFASGGFAHIMSNRPIANLEDMQGLKVWVPDGDRISYDAVKALGVSPVTMPLTDVLTGLQTELIVTIMGPPAGTIVPGVLRGAHQDIVRAVAVESSHRGRRIAEIIALGFALQGQQTRRRHLAGLRIGNLVARPGPEIPNRQQDDEDQ